MLHFQKYGFGHAFKILCGLIKISCRGVQVIRKIKNVTCVAFYIVQYGIVCYMAKLSNHSKF